MVNRTARAAEVGEKKLFDIANVEVPLVHWADLKRNKDGNREWFRPWTEYHFDAKRLAHKLHLSGVHYGLVISIARGGQVAATIIERELNIRYALSLPVKSYDHQTKSPPQILIPLGSEIVELINAGEFGENILIVDDLADTGDTAEFVLNYLQGLCPKVNFHFVTIYTKGLGRNVIHDFVTEVPQDVWIRQPFDLDYQHAEAISGPEGN